MPVYYCLIEAEEVVMSGEAQALMRELDVSAILAAAGWVIAGASAYFFGPTRNDYPTTIDGISFAWQCADPDNAKSQGF